MSDWLVRASHLTHSSEFARVSAGVRAHLQGKPIGIPAQLSPSERDELMDVVSTLLALPCKRVLFPTNIAEPCLQIAVAPSDEWAPSTTFADQWIIGPAATTNTRQLALGSVLFFLRNAVTECLMFDDPSAPTALFGQWSRELTDSPVLAMRFMGGALAAQLRTPQGTETEWFVGGLVEVVSLILRDLEPTVAEWVVARAIEPKYYSSLVDAESAALGESIAWKRAFSLGVIESFDPNDTTQVQLRRPLTMLSKTSEWPVALEHKALLVALRTALAPRLQRLVDRFEGRQAIPLGLDGPDAMPLVGRDTEVARIVAMSAPTNSVSISILYGFAGTDSIAVAALAAKQLAHWRPTLWLNFANGPLAGWGRLAALLEIDFNSEFAQRMRDELPVWIHSVFSRVRERPYFIVIENIEALAENEVARWLPQGPGECSVLVLSSRRELPLVRDTDAVTIALNPLSLEHARQLLAEKSGARSEDVQNGKADALLRKIGGNVAAILALANLLRDRSIEDVEKDVSASRALVPTLIVKLVDGFDRDERLVAYAIATCTLGPTDRALIERAFDEDPTKVATLSAAVDRLIERGVLKREGPFVRLAEVIRLECALRLRANASFAMDLEQRLAPMIERRLQETNDGTHWTLHDRLIEEALGLSQQLRERVARTRDLKLVRVASNLAGVIAHNIKRGDVEAHLTEAVKTYELCLDVVSPNRDPKLWAVLNLNFGGTMAKFSGKTRHLYLARAIAASESALSVLSRETDPQEWAAAQSTLGAALAKLSRFEPDQRPTLMRAISAFEKALEVCTRDRAPIQWAALQINLAAAISDLPDSNLSDNFKHVIQTISSSLEVLTMENNPVEWTRAQHNLGNAWYFATGGDKATNMTNAITAYTNALQTFTSEQSPVNWAGTQFMLGLALAQLPTGDRVDNLSKAIDAFDSALMVYTAEDFESDRQHALTARSEASRLLREEQDRRRQSDPSSHA